MTHFGICKHAHSKEKKGSLRHLRKDAKRVTCVVQVAPSPVFAPALFAQGGDILAFLIFVWSMSKFYLKMNVFYCFNVLFGLPYEKPCRIILKLRQKVISIPESCEI